MRKNLPTLHIDDCLRPQLRKSTSDIASQKTSANSLNRNHTYSEVETYNENLERDLNDDQNCDNVKRMDTSNFADLKTGDFVELWRANPMPDRYHEYYNFNYFAMCLNEMKSEYAESLAPTDTRHRKDIRFLENGDLEGAAREKLRLEEKQREARKNSKDETRPRWFQLSKSPIDDEETWLFNEKYWNREYKDCPDLY
jgi:hypothetical protein